MMLKKGVCKNFENCTLADNQEIQEVDSSEFICAECGKPLYEVKGPKPPFPPKWLKLVIAVLIIAGLATGGYFLFRSCSNSKVRITVLSSDETMGTVKGSGKYEFNKLITIEANANEGYRFVSWDDNNTKNPREILTKEDGTYTAMFESAPALPASVTINVVSSDESMGVVRGGGTFGAGDTTKIEAEARNGYRFMSWNDGNTERTREIVATNDITYTAQFSPEPPQTAPVVTITVESSDETMGTVRGGGTYDSMITISIEAIANKGYEFDSWNDENIENPRKVITGRDETYVAKFKKIKSTQPLPPEDPTKGTIKYSIGKYVGDLKNGIPEGDGKFYYTCRVQIAKHDTDNPPHYAEAGDWFDGTWGNGDIVSGALFSKDGKIKEKIFAPKRFNPYDLHKEKCQ